MSASAGRPRDARLDDRILDVAQRHLAAEGYAGMSLAAVAADAGTTRQALYRRWPTKADLATAAIAALSRTEDRRPTADPFTDLVGELEDFRSGVSRPDGLSMIGTMLLDSTDPELVEHFRDRVVRPRRARLRAILERAAEHGLLSPDADIDLALSLLTGSWYALALAGERPPDAWADRIARLVWQSLGGQTSTPGRRGGGRRRPSSRTRRRSGG